MNSSPLVSIIIPCFNAERWIGAALDSSLAQSYRPLEVLVVDDGSTDASATIVANYNLRNPAEVRLICQANKGPAAARNLGFSHASGKYIQWLDADDLLEPNKISAQVEYLEFQPEVDVAYGDWKDLLPSNISDSPVIRRKSFCFKDFLEAYLGGKWVALHAFLMRRSTKTSYIWDESLQALEDHDYWLELAIQGTTFAYVAGADCAIYRASIGTARRNQMTPAWLDARLSLFKKAKRTLSAVGMLDQKRYRETLAATFVGVADRSFVMGVPTLADAALTEAFSLVPESELYQVKSRTPLFRPLGVRGSLVVHAAFKRRKNRFKHWAYRRLALDWQATWRQNVRHFVQRIVGYGESAVVYQGQEEYTK